MSTFWDDLRQMGKPREVEEIWDIYFIRPAGCLLVRLLRRTAITPNLVSALSVLAGWASAACLYVSASGGGRPLFAAAAGLCLYLSSVLDSADGQLARATGRFSPLGPVIDGLCDNLVFLGIYAAIAFGYWQHGGPWPQAVALLTVIGMASHSFHCSLTEYYRSQYVRNVLSYSKEEKQATGTSAMAGSPSISEWLLQFLYAGYSGVQRRVCRASDALQQRLRALRAADARWGATIASIYAKAQRTMVRAWALTGPNAHKIGLGVAAFVPAMNGGFWSELGVAWYLLYEACCLNLVLLGLIWRQGRADGAVRSAIEKGLLAGPINAACEHAA